MGAHREGGQYRILRQRTRLSPLSHPGRAGGASTTPHAGRIELGRDRALCRLAGDEKALHREHATSRDAPPSAAAVDQGEDRAVSVHARSLSTALRVAAWEGPSRGCRQCGRARGFCLPTAPPPARTKRELNCYGQRCRAMNERSKASSRVGSGPRRLPCERFWPNEPERVLAGHARHLGSSLAFWLKNSLYFSCCLQGGLFCYSL